MPLPAGGDLTAASEDALELPDPDDELGSSAPGFRIVGRLKEIIKHKGHQGVRAADDPSDDDGGMAEQDRVSIARAGAAEQIPAGGPVEVQPASARAWCDNVMCSCMHEETDLKVTCYGAP